MSQSRSYNKLSLLILNRTVNSFDAKDVGIGLLDCIKYEGKIEKTASASEDYWLGFELGQKLLDANPKDKDIAVKGQVTPYCGDCKRMIEKSEQTSTPQNKINLRTELVSLLNTHSIENGSDTPDYILADYMMSCLDSFEIAVTARTKWHGKGKR